MPLAQALAGQFDAIGVMNDAVEDGVSERGYPDQIVPAVDGNLAGDDERAFVVAILDDFQQIARLIGRERFGSPVVQDEQLDARQGPQEPGVARIPMGDGQIGEEPGHAGVEDGHMFSRQALWPRAQANQLLPKPDAPVTSKLRRSAIQSQAASLRNSARSSPRGL